MFYSSFRLFQYSIPVFNSSGTVHWFIRAAACLAPATWETQLIFKFFKHRTDVHTGVVERSFVVDRPCQLISTTPPCPSWTVIKWKCKDVNKSQRYWIGSDTWPYTKSTWIWSFISKSHNLHIPQYYRILYIIQNITTLQLFLSLNLVSTLSSAFETRVSPYALGYMGAPWQLCLFENCEYIIDN